MLEFGTKAPYGPLLLTDSWIYLATGQLSFDQDVKMIVIACNTAAAVVTREGLKPGYSGAGWFCLVHQQYQSSQGGKIGDWNPDDGKIEYLSVKEFMI